MKFYYVIVKKLETLKEKPLSVVKEKKKTSRFEAKLYIKRYVKQ